MAAPLSSALAGVIAEESGLPADDPACAALAHFALEAPRVAHDRADFRQAVTRAFELLENGWTTLASPGTETRPVPRSRFTAHPNAGAKHRS